MRAVISHLGATALIIAMVFCALMLWAGIPVIWLYIGSQVVDSTQPSMGPYALVGFGILFSVIVDGIILGRLNRQYQKVTHSDGQVRVQLPWMRSMRGERGSTRKRGVLDTVMIVSVGAALALFGIWFFAFAGSSLPGS